MHDFKQIENLVFEGSSIKGYVYVQVLREIVKKYPGFLINIKRYAGTSSGSMFAVLLCMQHNIDEIDDILVEISHMDLFQKKRCKFYNFVANIYSLYKQYGIYDIYPLERFVRYIIKKQWYKLTGVDEDPTFKKIYEFLDKELILTSTNMNTNELVYFSHKLTPNVPIYKAVVSSSCIPGIFKPLRYNFNPDLPKRNNVYLMDGGIILNYPIFVFDHDDPHEAFRSRHYNDKTLGFLIQTKDDDLFNQKQLHKKITGLKTFVSNTINIVSKQLEKKIIKREDWSRTVQIFVKNYSSSDIVLTENIRKELNDAAIKSISMVII